MPLHTDKYHLVLRSGLAVPEAHFIKLYCVQLTDQASGEHLSMLRCKHFEIVAGYFAKVTAIDIEDNELTNELWVPLHMILMIYDASDETKTPIGFTPA